MNKVLVFVVSVIAITACKQQAENTQVVLKVDSLEQTEEDISKLENTDSLSFIHFWEQLKSNLEDSSLIKSIIAFPYPYGSFTNMLVREDSFYGRKVDRGVLKKMLERERIEIYSLNNKGINSFVKINLVASYENLNGIYVVT